MNRRSGPAQSGSESRMRQASAAPVAEKPGSVESDSRRSRRAPADIPERRRDRAGVVAQSGSREPKPEGLVRASLRLVVATEAVERPGQGIGGADGRRGRVAGLGELERRGRIAVIRLEEGQLDIDDDPAGLEQLDLGAGQLDVACRLVGSAGGGLGLGQGDDVLGQRQDVRGALEEGDRLVEVAGADRQPALPGERRGMARARARGPARRRPRQPPGRPCRRAGCRAGRSTKATFSGARPGVAAASCIALSATSSLPCSSATYETRASVDRSARIASISSAAASASS